MIKQNQKYLNIFLVILDVLCLIISIVISWFIRFKSGILHVDGSYLPFISYFKPAIYILPIYLILYSIFSLYTPYRMKSIFDEFLNIVKANFLGILIFILALYLLKQVNYSRYFLFIFAIVNTITMTLERTLIRAFLRRLRKNGKNQKYIILVGYSELTEELLKRIYTNKHWGYNIVGIVDDKLYIKNKKTKPYTNNQDTIIKAAKDQIAACLFTSEKILGNLDYLENILENYTLDEVFVTLGIKEYDKLPRILNLCEKYGVRTEIVPGYYKYMPVKPYVEEVDGLPIINTRYVPLDNMLNMIMKRLFDIVVSIIAIIVFSPIILLTTIIIKMTSPGPVLFKQERVGFNRKKFTMYKFRSMHVQKEAEEKVQWTTKDDPRKTKFGTFIRKTSIDELPQLFNVLKGDMSLVGPRPERPYFVQQFKEEIPKYMIKHQVRPGITGWAQVNGWRGDTSIEKRIECDIYYIENWNFWLDIKIIFLTIFKGFVNKNAY